MRVVGMLAGVITPTAQGGTRGGVGVGGQRGIHKQEVIQFSPRAADSRQVRMSAGIIGTNKASIKTKNQQQFFLFCLETRGNARNVVNFTGAGRGRKCFPPRRSCRRQECCWFFKPQQESALCGETKSRAIGDTLGIC